MQIDFGQAAKAVFALTKEKSPVILVAAAGGGVVATAIMASKASPIAMDMIFEKTAGEPDSINFFEKAKITWRVWIPTLSVASVTIACVIGSNQIQTRRSAALAATLGLVEQAAATYQEKTQAFLTDKQKERVSSEIAQKAVDAKPLSQQVVVITQKGQTLMFDSLSGRYFKSDVDAIKKSVNEFNYDLMNITGNWKSVNEWSNSIGLENTEMGDLLGWSTDHLLDVEFHPSRAEDDVPCFALVYSELPYPWNRSY